MAAIKLALRLRLGQQPHANETVEGWMRRWEQTPNIIRALWEPLCIAALNEPVATGSAQLFATVIRRSFLAGAADSSILLSRVGLSELFAPEVKKLLEMCRGTLRLQTPVTGSALRRHDVARDQAGRRLRAPTGGGGQRAAVARPARPACPAKASWRRPARQIQDAPIVSLHLWLDRPILREPFVGLLDSPVHWVFSRDHIQGPIPPVRRAMSSPPWSAARAIWSTKPARNWRN